MTARVMAVNGQIVPKERVNTKAVVTMAKVASQQFSVGIVVAIIKLQTVSRTIMCVKFLMNKIHHNNSSSNNSLLHLRLSLPSHSAFQIQQRLQQHQPQHIVLTVYLHMMIRVIWFSICVAVMWTFQTCEFVLWKLQMCRVVALRDFPWFVNPTVMSAWLMMFLHPWRTYIACIPMIQIGPQFATLMVFQVLCLMAMIWLQLHMYAFEMIGRGDLSQIFRIFILHLQAVLMMIQLFLKWHVNLFVFAPCPWRIRTLRSWLIQVLMQQSSP